MTIISTNLHTIKSALRGICETTKFHWAQMHAEVRRFFFRGSAFIRSRPRPIRSLFAMRINNRNSWGYVWIILLAINLAACASPPTPAPTAQPVSLPTIYLTDTLTPTPTDTPTPTVTPLPTNTLTPTLTPTPVPVLKNPCASYYDQSQGTLKYACLRGGRWP